MSNTLQVYTLKEARELLKISRATLYRLIKAGKINTITLEGTSRRKYIRHQELERYLDKSENK